ANMFVAGFIGTPQMNFREDARLEKEDGKYVVRLLGVSYALSPEKQEILKRKNAAPCEVTAGIRPEDVEPCNEGEGIRAFVELSELMGSEKYIHVNVNTHALVLRVKAGVDVQNGGALHFMLLDDKIHLFDKTTNTNLLAEM
ncbi:MAG TPA: TOBE domain-containing protein, partial [Ignavibacteriales bacterium]|nr:TOBE domain-containing protein [Ignavibacteriales bacterium]